MAHCLFIDHISFYILLVPAWINGFIVDDFISDMLCNIRSKVVSLLKYSYESSYSAISIGTLFVFYSSYTIGCDIFQ